MATIVHITADYPDAHSATKTPAVLRLLEQAPEHCHIVYSLNRLNGLGGVRIKDQAAEVSTITYRAPPYGVLLESHLLPVATLILDDLKRRAIAPDLIHAHKLTIDGIVGNEVAQALDAPLVCSVWGNTDQKVIEAKPFSRRRFHAIACHARALLPATPWAAAYIETRLRVDPRKIRIMPIVSKLSPPQPSAPAHNRIATLFNLDAHEGKNIASLIEAVAELRRSGVPAILDIFGGGGDASVARIKQLMSGKESFIALRGPLPHQEVQTVLNRYAAFALPSKRETYGMVFIEALYAGVPIIYPKGQALDGFFDDADVGSKCDARNPTDIAASLAAVLDREAVLKNGIWTLHQRGYFRRFEPSAIAATYREVVAMATRTAAAA